MSSFSPEIVIVLLHQFGILGSSVLKKLQNLIYSHQFGMNKTMNYKKQVSEWTTAQWKDPTKKPNRNIT
jgi:hypothetical protein